MLPAHDLLQLMREAAAARDLRRGRCASLRAVIEFSSHCVRNCLYCGMRRDNNNLQRYREPHEDILAAARTATAMGIRSIMLQSGDDLQYPLPQLCRTIQALRQDLDAEVILCVGDMPRQVYRELFAAGAGTAVLKFETTNAVLFRILRPGRELGDRLRLLGALRQMGYALSSGFMAGLPGETRRDQLAAVSLVASLDLAAASVSPFIPNDLTPLRSARYGSLLDCLWAIASMRLANPRLRIAAVSALNLVAHGGRLTLRGQTLGLRAGADGLTVNTSDPKRRGLFPIYSSRRILVRLFDVRKAAAAAGMRLDAGNIDSGDSEEAAPRAPADHGVDCGVDSGRFPARFQPQARREDRAGCLVFPATCRT